MRFKQQLFYNFVPPKMDKKMKVLIIGGGNMGFTYAKGIAAAQMDGVNVGILEPQATRRNFLATFEGFTVYKDDKDCVPPADVILLAVKPQVCLDLFGQIKSFINPDQLIISIMAGVATATIAKHLNTHRIVRAMPNLPAQLGKGMTGFYADDAIGEQEKKTVTQLLQTTGEVMAVADEAGIDSVTGISGSGSAYVFYFMEAMVQAALQMGFDEQQAKTLVLQTFDGAVAQFKASEDSLPVWIDRVTSKGGTTQAALNVLDEQKVAQHIKDAVKAAEKRAGELAKLIQ